MKHKTQNRLYYGSVHKWLYYWYGKANRCDNPNCPKACKYFSWALKKGREYEHNRDNFIQLCLSCHAKYDFTEKIRKHLIAIHKGKPASPQAYEANRKKLTGVPRTKEDRRKIKLGLLKRKERLGYINSPKTRKKMGIAQKKRWTLLSDELRAKMLKNLKYVK